ncbi:MAG: cobalamin-dependent protein [Rhodobacteraceae bacterium]|nr:cobalamin-dependent protein [Paracoccaceae bacterium]
MAKYDFSEFDFSAGYRMLNDGFLDNKASHIPYVQQCHEFNMRHMGDNAWQFYSDPETFVYGALKTAKDFGFDTPDLCWDAYNLEAEAIGCDIAKFDDLTPAIDNTQPMITNEKDLIKMKPLDLTAGRIPFAMDVSTLFREVTGEQPYLVFCAPFTLASHVMTFEKLVLEMQDNPAYVHKVMTYLTDEVLAPYINEFRRRFPGVKMVPGSDAVASLPFITLDMMEEFALGYIERLRGLTDNVAIVDNWWGDSFVDDQEKFWEFKRRANPHYLKVQDPDLYRVGAQKAKNYADAHDLPVMFGVSNNLLTQGPAVEIEKRIHEYLEIMEPGGKNMLYLCNFSSETPAEFVRASVAAINSFRAGDRPWLGQHKSGSPEATDYEKFGKKTAAEKEALKAAKAAAPVVVSTLSDEAETLLDDLFDYVVDGEDEAAIAAVNRALELDVPLSTILDGSLISAMEEVGGMFSDGTKFVPEMLLSARAMKNGLEILRPLLTKSSAKPKGLVMLATVQGDVHDIGKNLVGMMLEGAGYKVIDMGVNNPAQEILEKAREVKPDVIGLSALLTTTMPNMSKVIKLFRSEDEPYPIIVGGAPVTQSFADVIGADGYGADAPGAVNLVHSLVTKGHNRQQHHAAAS